MALLKVEDLSIGYTTRNGLLRAVEGVSFALDPGGSLGLVGESGCGKTTLGMALMGLLPANGKVISGKMLFEGGDLRENLETQWRKIRWRKISMIFQAAMNALNPVHRVGDQIAEAIRTHMPDMTEQEIRARVGELYRLVGLPEERISDYPHQYSGGMRQRAIIAMALACNPKLIIADEPTTALDVIVQDQILKEIKRLQKQLDLSIIFISHDISIVAEVCEDIGVMYAGQLVELGPKEAVFDNPVHPYTKALLASYPTLMGAKERLRPIPGEPPNLLSPPSGCRFCERCPISGKTCKFQAPQWALVGPRHKALCNASCT